MANILHFLILTSLVPVFYLPFTGKIDNPVYTFGNISGFIGAIFLVWKAVLGIIYIFFRGRERGTVMRIHMNLGVFGLFFILLHPVIEMFYYGKDFSFLFLPSLASESDLRLALGRIAIFLLIPVWATSIYFRSRMKFGIWKAVHYLSYPATAAVLAHAFTIGTFLSSVPLIYYYWWLLISIMILSFLARVIIASKTYLK